MDFLNMGIGAAVTVITTVILTRYAHLFDKKADWIIQYQGTRARFIRGKRRRAFSVEYELVGEGGSPPFENSRPANHHISGGQSDLNKGEWFEVEGKGVVEIRIRWIDRKRLLSETHMGAFPARSAPPVEVIHV